MCRRVKYKCRDNIYCSIRNIIGLILLVLSSAAYVKAQVAVIGTQSVIPQSQTASPYGVVVDSAGNLYVSDTQKGEILCFSSTGTACGIPFPISSGQSSPKSSVESVSSG
uniref:NHL repeat protein n=1 Tax=mine drainage metagenome TaxID=410659 RepID=E6QIV2_9ZZZZ